MPSVIGLLEFREARAREELESWLEVVREAEEHVAVDRRRLEHARIACDEVLHALAEQAESGVGSVPAGQKAAVVPDMGDGAWPSALAGAQGMAAVTVPVPALREGYDPRPPAWQDGMGEEALSGAYRQVFAAVVSARGAGVRAGADARAGAGRDAVERGGEGAPPRLCAPGAWLAGA
ncbi:hypothetical protein ACIQU6_44585 [Streptomyces sp. NPDC090442]|uniref:hypothetical protein n=1 Tax=Streptomyces sp. NPDC090442 TaxID=3365962 RepID=UPI0038092BE7